MKIRDITNGSGFSYKAVIGAWIVRINKGTRNQYISLIYKYGLEHEAKRIKLTGSQLYNLQEAKSVANQELINSYMAG